MNIKVTALTVSEMSINMLNEISHPYQLDKSIKNFRVVEKMVFFNLIQILKVLSVSKQRRT